MYTDEARATESNVEVLSEFSEISVSGDKAMLNVSLSELPTGFKMTETVRLTRPCDLKLTIESKRMDVCEECRRFRRRSSSSSSSSLSSVVRRRRRRSSVVVVVEEEV